MTKHGINVEVVGPFKVTGGNTMSTNVNPRTIETPFASGGGVVWNRLHSEREAICEALLKETERGYQMHRGVRVLSKKEAARAANWHRQLLQVRLSKVDDALDRLMSGAYGNCSHCDKWIEDTKLEFDPAIAFCIGCWERMQTQH